MRATIHNSAGLLKPEMFASVKTLTGEGDAALAVSRDAIIYGGDVPHAWAVRDDGKAIENAAGQVGQTSTRMVEILEGLVASDRVITRGSLFIDRVAAAGR